MNEQPPHPAIPPPGRRPLGLAFRWAAIASLPVLPLVLGLSLLSGLESPAPLVTAPMVFVLLVAWVILPLLAVFTLWAFVAPHWRWLERPWPGLAAGAVLVAGAVMLLPPPRLLVLAREAGPFGQPRAFLATVGVMAVSIRLARWRRLGVAPGVFASAPRVKAGTWRFAALCTALVAVLAAGAAGIASAAGSLVYERFRPRTDAELWAAYRAATGPDEFDQIRDERRIADAAGALLERFPYETGALVQRGRARVETGDTLAGLRDLVLAMSIEGCGAGRSLSQRLSAAGPAAATAGEVWRWYAGCERERGRLSEAQSAYLRAIENGAGRDTWYLRGGVRLAMGDTSLACLNRGKAYDPRQGPPAGDIALSPELERACSAPARVEETRRRLARQTGVIDGYDPAKGMGHIVPDDRAVRVFVHHSDILGTDSRSVRDGDRVEFDEVEATRGRRAANVRRLP
jgi:CspA family cold shock protein